MSATTPPSPDGEPRVVDQVSSNGARRTVRTVTAQRLVVLGYITAVAMPVIGLVLGIVIATRRTRADSKHGTRIILLSLVGGVLWILVFTSGLLATPNNDLGGY